jgi:trans-aconitate methyltransferase
MLKVAASSLKHDVDNKQVNHRLFNHEMFNTLIDTVKKSSPTFHYLIHAIATWSCQKNKQILMRNAPDEFINESIYTLTTVMILHQLRKTHNVYVPGFCDESLCTKANIQEFIQALHDDAQWIRDQQAMLITYIEDIDGEINSWLISDVNMLLAVIRKP